MERPPAATQSSVPAASTAVESATSAIVGAWGRASNSLRTNSSALILTVLAILVIIILVIVYLVRFVMKNGNMTDIHIYKKAPKQLYGKPATIISSGQIPVIRAGQDFAFSLWLYVADVQPSALGKLVMMRAPQGAAGSGGVGAQPFRYANPIIFMDPSANKLYVAMRTNLSGPRVFEPSTIMQIVTTPANINPYVVATIDYLPMQRWIHLVCGARDGLVSIFMNGSLYTVEQTRSVVSMSSGEIALGPPAAASAASEVRGFISNVRLMNFMPSQERVEDLFERGPASGGSGMLARVGISSDYRVRSPIYRLGSEDDNTDIDD